MDRLWAPWRSKYVTAIAKNKKTCTLCRIAKKKKDKDSFIFIRRRYCYAVLNIYPYNNGHSLVLPYRHIKNLSQLTKQERQELFDLLDDTKTLLDKVLKPDGYNIGMNLGRSAGAGFPGHLHIHIVPRWQGDVNFMPIMTDTRVISQSLKSLYEKIVRAHRQQIKKRK